MKRTTLLLTVVIVASLSARADEASKKVVLFDGKTLDGWIAEGASTHKPKDGDAKPVWSVNGEGNLFCDGSSFGFLRHGERKYKDFHFHVEFRMAKKCNSGIGIRTVAYDPKKSGDTRPSYACYEIQLLDDAGQSPSKKGTGSLYRYVAPASNPIKAAGEWNVMDIRCVGPHITIHFNGEKTIDVDQSTIATLKDKPLEGYLCLQNHGGKIEFRNLWVEELLP